MKIKEKKFQEWLENNSFEVVMCADCGTQPATHSGCEGDLYCLNCLYNDYEVEVV